MALGSTSVAAGWDSNCQVISINVNSKSDSMSRASWSAIRLFVTSLLRNRPFKFVFVGELERKHCQVVQSLQMNRIAMWVKSANGTASLKVNRRHQSVNDEVTNEFEFGTVRYASGRQRTERKGDAVTWRPLIRLHPPLRLHRWSHLSAPWRIPPCRRPA